MKSDDQLLYEFLKNHPAAAIKAIGELPVEEIAILAESIPDEQSAFILTQLMPYTAGRVLEKISHNKIKIRSVIEQLPLSNAESLLRQVNLSLQHQILDDLNQELSKHLKRILAYNKNYVGAYLNSYIFTLSANSTVEHALHEIRHTSAILKPRLYILEENHAMVGYVDITELLSADAQKIIRSLAKPSPVVTYPDSRVDDLLENWNDVESDIPVLMPNGEFLGTVSYAEMTKQHSNYSETNNSAISAGNALGDLYIIGLTSLLGNSDLGKKKK